MWKGSTTGPFASDPPLEVGVQKKISPASHSTHFAPSSPLLFVSSPPPEPETLETLASPMPPRRRPAAKKRAAGAAAASVAEPSPDSQSPSPAVEAPEVKGAESAPVAEAAAQTPAAAPAAAEAAAVVVAEPAAVEGVGKESKVVEVEAAGKESKAEGNEMEVEAKEAKKNEEVEAKEAKKNEEVEAKKKEEVEAKEGKEGKKNEEMEVETEEAAEEDPEEVGMEEAVEEGFEEEEVEEEEEEGEEEEEEEEEKAAKSSEEVTKEASAMVAADDPNEVAEQGPEEIEGEATHGDVGDKDGGVHQLNGDGDVSGSEDDDAENDEVDPSLYMPASASERKDKEIEIFVGGLPKDAVEEDVTKVFCEFGEIQSVRIVKNPATQKCKGFAFVRYVDVEAAKKVLAEFKDGTEVNGKRVRISASQDNNTLYLGNICKTWTKDQVLETLKSLGVEEIEHIRMPDEPDNGGKSKGFAFVEFGSHSHAMAAFHRLRKPDAILGHDRSAKVAFAQSPLNPSEDLLMKVKTVYLEHVPLSWDEGKIRECCKEYGEIEKVQIFRKANKAKKKDFSFVEFGSRESALACVEGINNAQIGDGEVKVCAKLAKPLSKGRLPKQAARGGFKVNSGADTKEASHANKGKSKEKEEVDKKVQPALSKRDKSKNISRGAPERQQTSQPFRGKNKRVGRSTNTISNERPSKKARNNRDVRKGPPNVGHSGTFRNVRGAYGGKPPARNIRRPAGPRYATNYQTYPYGSTSGSNAHRNDLEPHAGYLPPANRVQSTQIYNQRRSGPYNSHQMYGPAYAGEPAAPGPAYSGYPSYPGYQAGYAAYPPPSGSYPGGSTYNARSGYY